MVFRGIKANLSQKRPEKRCRVSRRRFSPTVVDIHCLVATIPKRLEKRSQEHIWHIMPREILHGIEAKRVLKKLEERSVLQISIISILKKRRKRSQEHIWHIMPRATSPGISANTA